MTIADNKKAFHDYFIEERFEAGVALEGWEVKSIRAGRVQLKEAYVIVKSGEIFLFGSHHQSFAYCIDPCQTGSGKKQEAVDACVRDQQADRKSGTGRLYTGTA